VTSPQADPVAPGAHRLSFHGTGGALFGIYLQNLLLSIVTLGIYSFWGRTRVRQYLWSQTEIAGDRLAYHGTGKELLSGWAKAMGVLMLAYLVTFVVIPLALRPALGPEVGTAVGVLVFYALFVLLIPVAVVGARRYRLSRTSWRGIRCSFHGRIRDLLKLYVSGFVIQLVTLTLYSPIYRNDVRRFFTAHTRFGSLPFEYDGRGYDLFRRYVLSLLLTIPTLGLCWFWYAAAQDRYYWEHTIVGGARFHSTVTGGSMLGLAVKSLLLIVFTLGLGAPWAMVWIQRYRCDTLSLASELDLSAVTQQAQAASGVGEGFATAFDVDGIDAGIGF
jgi:uncharacterized membrane protein YjgN (DUF898 family)